VPFGYWHVFAEWIVQYYVEGAQQESGNEISGKIENLNAE
jgi:hypothetical protein